MSFIRAYRPANIYLILFPILFIMSIVLTFYDARLIRLESFHEINSSRSISKDYFHVNFDVTSNTAHCQSTDHLIIYILSTVTNIRRRQSIRSTWGSPLISTCFVFILGRIADEKSTIQSQINDEKRRYNDIIQIDHNESYANVVYKEVGALQWSAYFYPSIPYLFKTDDDLIVDSILISEIATILATNVVNDSSYISTHRPELARELLRSDRSNFFRGGWSMDFSLTLRSSKFAVSESVWPHPVLPLYCSGFGWLMSKEIRNRLVQASLTYPLSQVVWIGDVFVSGFLAKAAKSKCTGLAIDYEQTSLANCPCLMMQKSMLTVCSSTFHSGVAGDDERKYEEYEKLGK